MLRCLLAGYTSALFAMAHSPTASNTCCRDTHYRAVLKHQAHFLMLQLRCVCLAGLQDCLNVVCLARCHHPALNDIYHAHCVKQYLRSFCRPMDA